MSLSPNELMMFSTYPVEPRMFYKLKSKAAYNICLQKWVLFI